MTWTLATTKVGRIGRVRCRSHARAGQMYDRCRRRALSLPNRLRRSRPAQPVRAHRPLSMCGPLRRRERYASMKRAHSARPMKPLAPVTRTLEPLFIAEATVAASAPLLRALPPAPAVLVEEKHRAACEVGDVPSSLCAPRRRRDERRARSANRRVRVTRFSRTLQSKSSKYRKNAGSNPPVASIALRRSSMKEPLITGTGETTRSPSPSFAGPSISRAFRSDRSAHGKYAAPNSAQSHAAARSKTLG